MGGRFFEFEWDGEGRWGGCLFEVGTNLRLGAYSNKYGILSGDLTDQGVLALKVWGAYFWRGLYMERVIFRVFWPLGLKMRE